MMTTVKTVLFALVALLATYFTATAATLHVGPGETYTAIQPAIDAASAGDSIVIASGTYTENINVDKHLIIIGSGSDASGTIITQLGSNADPNAKVGVIQLSASGTVTDYIVIKNLRLEPESMAGISVGRFPESTGANISYVRFENVKVYGTNTNPSTEQERGFYVDNTSSASDFSFIDCEFNNLTYGWYFQKEVSADASNVSDVYVANTTFNHNNHKGLYAEKGSNMSFYNCEWNNNGFDATSLPSYFYPWMAGVDVNLKAGNYANWQFINCNIKDNALGGAKEGVGITLKARNDALSYNTYPATLDNVLLDWCDITGNERGVRIGEPGKDNAGPTNVIVKRCNIYGNNQAYTGTDGTAYGQLINQSQADVEANHNWWNASDLATISSGIKTGSTGIVEYGYYQYRELTDLYYFVEFDKAPRLRDQEISLNFNISKETADIASFQFDIMVPKELTDDDADVVHYDQTATITTNKVDISRNLVEDNADFSTYRFVITPYNNDPANLFHENLGGSGDYQVLSLDLAKITSGYFDVGDEVYITIKDVVISQPEGTPSNVFIRNTDSLEKDQTLSFVFKPTGDINNDGVVNVLDLMMIVNHVLGIKTLTGTEYAEANLNRDEAVNILDAMLLLKIINGDEIYGMIPGASSQLYLIDLAGVNNEFVVSQAEAVWFKANEELLLNTQLDNPMFNPDKTALSQVFKEPTSLKVDFANLGEIEGWAIVRGNLSSVETIATTAMVYPNPANNQISIVNPYQGQVSLEIFDLQGNLVSKISVNNTEIITYATAGLSQGVYNFVITSGAQRSQGRFIVNH